MALSAPRFSDNPQHPSLREARIESDRPQRDPGMAASPRPRASETGPPLAPSAGGPAEPTMRTMTRAEIDQFVDQGSFAILSLAGGDAAYGVPLFYGTDGYAIYFQTRAGLKTPYLRATREACLTISRIRSHEEWASVQLLGSIEVVDAAARGSQSRNALVGIPPPLDWWESDERAGSAEPPGLTTYRLVPRKLIGRYSMPAEGTATERNAGFEGM